MILKKNLNLKNYYYYSLKYYYLLLLFILLKIAIKGFIIYLLTFPALKRSH